MTVGRPETLRGKLRAIAGTYGWTLCVGAGISGKVFGDWKALAKGLLDYINSPKEVVSELTTSQSSEAVIQTVFNFLSMTQDISDEDFINLLKETLYRQLRADCGTEWRVVAKALSSFKPGRLKLEEWQSFLDKIEPYKPSAVPLARVIARTVGTRIGPSSIITFNAEPLLFALINAYCAQDPRWQSPDAEERPLDRVAHDISQRHRASVPVYYVHGLLPVPDGGSRFNEGLSGNKLVFSENQYLQLSKSAYTWQSATFLSQCTQHRLVFFGLSFADPNLRRWLAWDHAGRTAERKGHGYATDKLQHYWIRQIPDGNSSNTKRMLQQSVAHLGVKIIWIRKWLEVGKALEILLEEDKAGS